MHRLGKAVTSGRQTLVALAAVLSLSIDGWGCCSAADDGTGLGLENTETSTSEPCERSAYERERTRYRCTADAELQTLECGEWSTLAICVRYGGTRAPELCTPGPEPGCLATIM